tara:strand:+ start:75 stop:224 length:150 start_codon:yes stop_codon:yes gene_type:complete
MRELTSPKTRKLRNRYRRQPKHKLFLGEEDIFIPVRLRMADRQAPMGAY